MNWNMVKGRYRSSDSNEYNDTNTTVGLIKIQINLKDLRLMVRMDLAIVIIVDIASAELV